jgi:hypothetical protein
MSALKKMNQKPPEKIELWNLSLMMLGCSVLQLFYNWERYCLGIEKFLQICQSIGNLFIFLLIQLIQHIF